MDNGHFLIGTLCVVPGNIEIVYEALNQDT